MDPDTWGRDLADSGDKETGTDGQEGHGDRNLQTKEIWRQDLRMGGGHKNGGEVAALGDLTTGGYCSRWRAAALGDMETGICRGRRGHGDGSC